MNDMFKVERMKKGNFIVFFVFLYSCCLLSPVFAESKWDAAGDEVSEAAKAVSEASKESWGKTKDAGSELWENTKETSSDLVETSASTGEDVVDGAVEATTSFWESTKNKMASWYQKGREKVHELTAPSDE